MTSAAAEWLADSPEPNVPVPLLVDVKNVVRYASSNAARSLQKLPGPSEIGHPCNRQLALKLIGAPRNGGGDPLPAIMGTGFHAWMENALKMDNQRLGRTRWIPEQRVIMAGEANGGFGGTCDCYDLDTHSAIDWKAPGKSKFDEYRRKGPSDVYRIQAHLYGYGYARLGFPVQNVAIVFFPRAGYLADTHLWSEAYDPTVAEQALSRWHQIIEVVDALGVEEHPERVRFISATPSNCSYCPYYTPRPNGPYECNGH